MLMFSGLNYLSAQCPFGTRFVQAARRHAEEVSITFRLSALSAPIADDVKDLARRARLNYLSAQCPFGT